MGGVGGGRLFVFDWEGEGGGVGWALMNFFSLWEGRLIDVGANSRLSASSNKYGMLEPSVVEEEVFFNSAHLSLPGTKQVISTLTHDGYGDNSPLQTDRIHREHSTSILGPSCSYIECDDNCA